jgi:6-pyruvoyltetrahydropterin/6-carboxytetrahydropterin synthase
MYYSRKTYGNDRGFSCAFRQWRSTHSHCSLLHGYSIGIELEFRSPVLDERNWVMDFGGLKAFEDWARFMFDHTVLVASDDPHLELFQFMATAQHRSKTPVTSIERPVVRGAVCDLRVVEAVGCEAFARMAHDTMSSILRTFKDGRPWQSPTGKTFTLPFKVLPSVELLHVRVFEHGANSATYIQEPSHAS